MGNLLSCKTTTAGGGGHIMLKKYHSGKIASPRVIFPTGEVRAIEEPTKAAELMMEAPNFMVVNADTLKVGARLSPLAADHGLETANLYVMLPFHRKHSPVTAADLASLFLAAADSLVVLRRHGLGKVRDLPSAETDHHGHEAEQTASYPRLLEGLDDETASSDAAHFLTVHRLSMSRSRKPLLDTIVEEPAGRRRRSIC
ncbi:unnamed protein product [Linum tenue]|uniref:Uncharacterized protein n=1 Tax=Linum tenue TaxID=586396 RepID=A0AAV0QQ16_9ROSI|nr:unnamed protein product [Linum tenue]